MRYTVSRPDVRAAYAQEEAHLAEGMTAAMGVAAAGLKQDLRDQVVAAGLGPRLANTWRGNTYPAGRASLDPSAYVWSKAPKLIDAFNRGASIVPLDGKRYLAIPTANVPLKGRGLLMTPLDVETSFNQDLILRRGAKGSILAFVNAVASTNRKGFRRATPRRLAQGRDLKLVLMFVLVRSVTLRKRLDIQAVANRWAGKLPALIADQFR